MRKEEIEREHNGYFDRRNYNLSFVHKHDANDDFLGKMTVA